MSNEFDNTAFNGNPEFGLPDGYFQKSAGSVFNRIEWLEEHKDLPALSAARNKDLFTVPRGYFAAAEEKLELLDCPVLLASGKKSGFTVPADYFNEAEVTELSKVMGATESALDFISRQNNFSVKPGYFEQNEKRLQNLLLNQDKPARVLFLFNTKAWMAAAALLVLALGFWMYDFYFVPAAAKDCGTMACIDRADLLKSKNLEALENEELYELVNTKKLEQELEKKSAPTQQDKKSDSLRDEALDELLDEI
ncbi:MAG TPA: hypothetical protein PL029_03355 [Bacteroidia bacterium]|nr:hypothetical protein [Bacteroidia bacterium]